MEEVGLCLGSVGKKLARTGVRKAGLWHRPASGDLNLRTETTSCSQPSPLTCYLGHCFLFSRVVGGRRKNAWILAALQARDLRLWGHWAAAPFGREEKQNTSGSPGCSSPPVAQPWAHGALTSRSFPTWSRFAERLAVSVRWW